MIAGINYQADIDLFLEAEEVKRLEAGTIEGVLIDRDKPKRQGTITISVRPEKWIGVKVEGKDYWGVKEGFRVEVLLEVSYYKELRERGFLGLRHRMLDGSKINIFDRSRLKETPTHVSGPEYLEKYYFRK